MKKRIVIKIGTNVLADKSGTLDYGFMKMLAEDISKAKNHGKDIMLVTSGAIGAGMAELKIAKRPEDVKMQQACAAVGQSILISKYRELFSRHGIKVAQILLTYNDFTDKKSSKNLGNSINALFGFDAIPIINENDPVSIDELGPSFGDNDKLSALIACKIKADTLIILTTVDGLYDRDPGIKGAKIVKEVFRFTKKIEALKGNSSALGLGGISTKIAAAKIATSAGITTIIANGRKKNIVQDLIRGKRIGTVFYPRRC